MPGGADNGDQYLPPLNRPTNLIEGEDASAKEYYNENKLVLGVDLDINYIKLTKMHMKGKDANFAASVNNWLAHIQELQDEQAN